MPSTRHAAILAATLALASPAVAQTGHYNGGIANLRDFVMPPPGLYYLQYNYWYHTETLRDADGNSIDSITIGDRTFDVDTTLDLFALAPALVYAPDWARLGDHLRFGAYILATFANPSIEAAVDDAFVGLKISQSTWGVGDLFVQPLWMEWSIPHLDVTAGYGFYAPVGRYHDGARDNIGLGYWTHQLQNAVALHLDREGTASLILAQTWEFNTRIDGQDLRPGSRGSLNWGISKIFFDGLLETAVIGYDAWQVGPDIGEDAPANDVRDEVHAAGIQLGVPKYGLALKYLREFRAVQRFEGNVVTFTFALPLDPVVNWVANLAE